MRIPFALLVLTGFLLSCNDEISVGSSLLEDGAIGLDYTDSLQLPGKTIFSEPVIVYRSSSNFVHNTYLLGQIDDPVFGVSRSELYLSSSIVDNFFPSFDTLRIDSVVMVLPLDTLGQFGQDAVSHSISVFQLNELLSPDVQDTIFSNQEFDAGTDPLGNINRVIDHKDSLEVYSPIRDSILRVRPQLRIPLDTQLWHRIATDTLINRDRERYEEEVKGFLVKTETNSSSIIGLDLSPTSQVVIELYYSANDTTKGVYFFDLGAVRSNYFGHDYTGTDVERAVNDGTNDAWYIQEMQGVDIMLDIGAALTYSDRVINRASLEFFALNETNPVIRPVEQLQAVYLDSSQMQNLVFDNLFQQQQNLSIRLFGGSVEEVDVDGTVLLRYSMDITNHLNAIIEGNIDNSALIIRSSNKSISAGRTIVFGPDSSYPPKLKLISSNP